LAPARIWQLKFLCASSDRRQFKLDAAPACGSSAAGCSGHAGLLLKLDFMQRIACGEHVLAED
jgi:hypothetical protein